MYQTKKGYSVLIIEDNPADQLFLQESLENTNLLIDRVITADKIKTLCIFYRSILSL